MLDLMLSDLDAFSIRPAAICVAGALGFRALLRRRGAYAAPWRKHPPRPLPPNFIMIPCERRVMLSLFSSPAPSNIQVERLNAQQVLVKGDVTYGTDGDPGGFSQWVVP